MTVEEEEEEKGISDDDADSADELNEPDNDLEAVTAEVSAEEEGAVEAEEDI